MSLVSALIGSAVLAGSSAFIMNLSSHQVKQNKILIKSVTSKRLPILLEKWSGSAANIRFSAEGEAELNNCLQKNGRCYPNSDYAAFTLKRVDAVSVASGHKPVEFNILGRNCHAKGEEYQFHNHETSNNIPVAGGTEKKECQGIFRLSSFFRAECAGHEPSCSQAEKIMIKWVVERKIGDRFDPIASKIHPLAPFGCGKNEVISGFSHSGETQCVSVDVARVEMFEGGENTVSVEKPFGYQPECNESAVLPADYPPMVGTESTDHGQLWPAVPSRYRNYQQDGTDHLCRDIDATVTFRPHWEEKYCNDIIAMHKMTCYPRFQDLATVPGSKVCGDWGDSRLIDGDEDYPLVEVWNKGSGQCGMKLVGKRGKSGCFASGTKIKTKRGWVAIDKVSYEDKVFNPVTSQWQSIDRIIRGPEQKPLITIVTDQGELSVTFSHPMPTLQGIVTAQQLRPGDRIISSQKKSQIIKHIRFDPALHDVWNLSLDADQHVASQHILLADGVPAGDLFLQENIANKNLSMLQKPKIMAGKNKN